MTSADRLAADQLRAILERLPTTGSQRDKRIRKAIAAAARALDDGRDPERAIRRAYGTR